MNSSLWSVPGGKKYKEKRESDLAVKCVCLVLI